MERASEFGRQLPLNLAEAYNELVLDLLQQGARMGSEASNEAWNSFLSSSDVRAGTCARCGTPILLKKTTKEFCSTTCRVQAHRAKNTA